MENTATIVQKANARRELLRRVASFGVSVEDLKLIYILFVKSHLEQSTIVWHSGLTEKCLKKQNSCCMYSQQKIDANGCGREANLPKICQIDHGH